MMMMMMMMMMMRQRLSLVDSTYGTASHIYVGEFYYFIIKGGGEDR